MPRELIELEADSDVEPSPTARQSLDGPAITVSKLFEEWEVELVDWEAVFAQW